MFLTEDEVREAFSEAARNRTPGEPVTFQHVAELLNRRLEDNLVGRVGGLAGKHQRPEPVK